MPQTAHKQSVKRRHVFFIPGYDPNVPRRYRELYRREGAAQAEISDYVLDVSGINGAPNYSWAVKSTIKGAETSTIVEFLTWEDIVRNSMDRTVVSAILVLLQTIWVYLSTGVFFRLVRLRPQPMLAALYPIVILVAQLAVSAGLAWGIAAIGGYSWLAFALGGIGFIALMTWFRRMDRHVFAYYLINDFGFNARGYGAYPEQLSARITQFADRIAAVSASGVDEILIVGHSTGAHMAVSALAQARGRIAPGPVISLLTLGHVIPMISFLPKAQRLRGDLNALSQATDLAWVDVSAPGDGGCFALSDPVHVTGVAPPEPVKHWPKVLSAAFALSLSPERLKQTKWQFFRRHIQYFCAFDRPRDYDYFQITAGPITLEERFAWRGATASRNERVLSRYRDF